MPDFETLQDAREDLVLADLQFAILFDSVETAGVSTLEDPSTGDLDVPATAESAGIIRKAAGVSLTHDIESNDVEGYGFAEPVRTIISKRTVEFQAEFLETNRTVLEKFWGTVFDSSNLNVSAHGGTTIKAPALPKNVFYRAYLVAVDDVNGTDLYAYYIMPRVKLVNVDNQDSQDDDAKSYSMTFRAMRDRTLGFAVLQGWCGPGWLKLVEKAGFVNAATSVSAENSTESVAEGAKVQLVVTADNGLNVTPICTYASDDAAKATVSASGEITGVAEGPADVTVSYMPPSGGPALTDTVSVTVTA